MQLNLVVEKKFFNFVFLYLFFDLYTPAPAIPAEPSSLGNRCQRRGEGLGGQGGGPAAGLHGAGHDATLTALRGHNGPEPLARRLPNKEGA